MRAAALVFALLCGMCPAAFAISISQRGSTIYLSGVIVPGDGGRFAAYLEQAPPRQITDIDLDSTGGQVNAAIHIALLVHQAGLNTVVDARRAQCDSACTLIFAAGVQRYYVHGDEVFEGYSSMTGLGYHSAHIKSDGVHKSHKSERGTDRMRELFLAFGQPAAAEFSENAPFNALFRPNGATALATHIATSLAPPPSGP